MSQSPRSLARLSYQKCEVQFKDLQVLFKFVVHFFLGPGRLCGATANQSARILKQTKTPRFHSLDVSLWLVRCARKLKDRKRAQNLISLLFRTSLILLSDVRSRSNGRQRVDRHNARCLYEERLRVGGSAEGEIVL